MGHEEDDLGARVRVARNWPNPPLSQTRLGEILGLERKSIAAIEANEERHELTIPEARKIAHATGVPVSFLLHGWAAPTDLLERVSALEVRATASEADREELAREIESLSAALERRIETYVTQALQRARQQAHADDPPAPATTPTP